MDLDFRIERGPETNHFLRRGTNQSHTVVGSGDHPHILTAFPAGNMTGALYFKKYERQDLRLVDGPHAVWENGRHGVRFRVESSARRSVLETVLLGSTRDVREHESSARIFSDARAEMERRGPGRLHFERTSLSSRAIYALDLELPGGTCTPMGQGWLLDGSTFQVTISNGERPLAPMPAEDIFRQSVPNRLSPAEREASLNLNTKEKILAGSWRYLTYFGRDPLLTQLYAMEFLSPAEVEVALGAALDRLNAAGDAAHEEAFGDWATRENLRAGRGAVDTPIYDYAMVDTVYLVAIHALTYVNTFGLERAASFFAMNSRREAFRRNLALILSRAELFAEEPIYLNLISFPPGRTVGDWRDSANGHGALKETSEDSAKAGLDPADVGGRYSFGINVALVPAALRAAAEVFGSYDLDLRDDAAAAKARRAHAVWGQRARPLFTQKVNASFASARALTVAAELGLPPPEPLSQDFCYAALSLDARGLPIQALHSDEGFDLLLNEPSEETLLEIAAHFLRPDGYGLLTPVGMTIVNPFLISDKEERRRFDRHEYHGEVIWGCEMAKVERGMAKQLAREDLSAKTRNRLSYAYRKLWKILEATRAHHHEELWTWEVTESEKRYAPYGEANALQAWSLVLNLLVNPFRGQT